MKKIKYLLLLILSLSMFGAAFRSINYISNSADNISASQNTGFTVGDSGKIFKTTDGGASWFLQTSNTTRNLNSVSLSPDSTTLVAVAVGDSGTVVRTTNGGINWSNLIISGSKKKLNSIYFLNSSTGIIAGDSGKIFRTTNVGNSWTQIISSGGTIENLNSVNFGFNSSSGAIAGNNGKVLITTNSGSNWTLTTNIPFQTNLTSAFLTISGVTSIYVTGINGFVYTTTDFGLTWNNVQPIGSASLNSISFKFFSSNVGITVGDGGKVYKTTNGGVNWIPKTSTVSENLNSVCQFNAGIAWAAGDNNKIIKSTDFGETWILQNNLINVEATSSEIPSSFDLKQNFPNPFNPATTIEFDIVKTAQVQLTVYNLSGEEVAKIYEGKLSPGSYRLKENFDNFPSGIYFYNLTAEHFSQTRKMALVK